MFSSGFTIERGAWTDEMAEKLSAEISKFYKRQHYLDESNEKPYKPFDLLLEFPTTRNPYFTLRSETLEFYQQDLDQVTNYFSSFTADFDRDFDPITIMLIKTSPNAPGQYVFKIPNPELFLTKLEEKNSKPLPTSEYKSATPMIPLSDNNNSVVKGPTLFSRQGIEKRLRGNLIKLWEYVREASKINSEISVEFWKEWRVNDGKLCSPEVYKLPQQFRNETSILKQINAFFVDGEMVKIHQQFSDYRAIYMLEVKNIEKFQESLAKCFDMIQGNKNKTTHYKNFDK